MESSAGGLASDEATRKADFRAIATLLAAYVAALLAYHPFADLTYGADDFAYAWSAQRLVLDGRLVASSWVAAAAVPQLFWAAAFCKLFGFSYRVLNVSTMVIGAFAPVLIYLLARELGIARRYAWLAAFFGVVSPYLGFSSSFMTDAYYEVFLLGAALLYARGLRRQRLGYFLGGSAVAAVAVLERQIGVATPAALVAALAIGVLTKRRRLGRGALEAALAASQPALVAAAYRFFPDAFGGVTPTQLVKLSAEARWTRFVDHAATLSASYTTLAYLGALLVPFVCAGLPAFRVALRELDSWAARALAGVMLAASLVGLWFASQGALRVRVPGEFLHTQSLPPSGMPVWYGLVALGSCALPLVAALFLVRSRRALWPAISTARVAESSSAIVDDTLLPRLFVALVLLSHGALVVTFISFFNNYFLPLVPLVLLLAATVLPTPTLSLLSKGRWLLPAGAGLFSFVWSTLSLDAMFRYVEADHRFAARVLTPGRRSHKVFNYMGEFARRNYDRSDSAIARNPWKAFTKMRWRAKYVIVATGGAPIGPFTRLRETESYRTLGGTRTLELRERPRKKTSKGKKTGKGEKSGKSKKASKSKKAK